MCVCLPACLWTRATEHVVMCARAGMVKVSLRSYRFTLAHQHTFDGRARYLYVCRCLPACLPAGRCHHRWRQQRLHRYAEVMEADHSRRCRHTSDPRSVGVALKLCQLLVCWPIRVSMKTVWLMNCSTLVVLSVANKKIIARKL